MYMTEFIIRIKFKLTTYTVRFLNRVMSVLLSVIHCIKNNIIKFIKIDYTEFRPRKLHHGKN